jgi:DNA polymerase-3 subunit beta
LEQVNIEGKRSGEGFVAHKDQLVNALSRAQGERVTLFDSDVTLGRKGFYAYLKALAGSNIVKVIPANGNASGSQVIAKGLKVVCGSHESYLPDGAWVGKGKKTLPYTFVQIRVSPCNAVMPNLGSVELAEALSKVLPFTATDEQRAVLQTVRLYQKDGKLTLTGCDGFSLSEVSFNFEDGEGEALIHRDELRGLIPALRKAKRVRLGFEEKADDDGGLLSKSVVIDTELVRYKCQSQKGEYPSYGKLIPTEFTANASFDTKEATKAIRSLLAVWYDDSLKPLYRPLILTIAEGKVVIEAKEDRGKAEITAETSGEGKVKVEGKRLIQALKACGGIVELKLVNASSPMLFTVDSHICLVMPMAMDEAKVEAKTEAKAEAETKAKPKGKAKRKAKAKRIKATEAVTEQSEVAKEPTAEEPEEIAETLEEPVEEPEAVAV